MAHATNFESLSVPSTSTVLAVLLHYDGSRFVESAFQALLGRPPDPEALTFYLNRVQLGTTKMQVLAEIGGSSEAVTYLELMRELKTVEAIRVHAAISMDEMLAHQDQAFVSCAYKTILGRHPSANEQERYLAELQKGIQKIQVLAEICASDEIKAKTKLLQEFAVAARQHDRAKMPLVGWLFKRLQSDHKTLGFEVKECANDTSIGSPPPEAKLAGAILSGGNPQFVSQLYATLLGREPDSHGFDFYLKRLETGGRRTQLIAEMIQSSECTRHRAMLETLDLAIRLYRSAENSLRNPSKPKKIASLVRALSDWPVVGRVVNVATALMKLSRLSYQQQILAQDDLPRLVQRHLDFDRHHNTSAIDDIPYVIKTCLDLAYRIDVVENAQLPQVLAALSTVKSQQHALTAEQLPHLLQALSDLKQRQNEVDTVQLPNLLHALSNLDQDQRAMNLAKDNLIKSAPRALRKMTRDLNILVGRSRNVMNQPDEIWRTSAKDKDGD